jgi:hypothetical protein
MVSMNTTAQSSTPLDANAIRAKLEAFANEAGKNCGCSYDVYVQKFSAMVEGLADAFEEVHHQAIFIVAREFDYMTGQELDAQSDLNAENGYCSHGIQLGCCPAGCE